MRLLFVSAQLPGHLDWGGYLPTAVELQRRGHEVLWASGQAVEQAVTSAGIEHHRIQESGWRWPPPPVQAADPHDGVQLQHRKQMRALDQWLDVQRVTSASTELSALIQDARPDLLISEMFVAAAGISAEVTATPLVIAGWPAPFPSHPQPTNAVLQLARRRLEQLLATFGVSGINWTAAGAPALCSPHLHISYWSERWFGGMPVGKQTRHVGGLPPLGPPRAAVPWQSLPAPEEAPWVLVTLGTSFSNDPAFFIAATHAVERLGGLPIVALGNRPSKSMIAALRDRFPRSVRVFECVPFDQVLPFTAAAIHHGGAGTTHALIRHAVPQIVVPHAGDQARQAAGIVRTGIGFRWAPAQVSLDILTDSLAQLLPDLSSQRRAARDLQAEFASLGGVPTAADLLESLHDTGHFRTNSD